MLFRSLTEKHLEELIGQSQVELFKLEKEQKNVEDQKSDFFE